MSSLVRRHDIAAAPRAKPFRMRSMELCLVGRYLLAGLGMADCRSQIFNLKFAIAKPVPAFSKLRIPLCVSPACGGEKKRGA